MKKSVLAAAAVAVALSAASPAGAITNGAPDTTHDYVGAMRGIDPTGTQRQCSGSLIDEGVFLTAGHCAGLTNVTIHFGDDLANEDVSFAATSVARHPEYSRDFGSKFDLAVVLFDQGATVLPTGQLAPVSYLDGFTKTELKAATFETYGYGLARDDVSGNSDPVAPTTVRRGATQTYLGDHNQVLNLSIHTHKDNGGGCFGDSGGPHLLDNVIVSITSAGDGKCVANDNTQRIDQPAIRAWITSFVD